MQFMNCNTCKRTVQHNGTGMCLGCQRGFVVEAQEDAWENHYVKPLDIPNDKEKLEERKKELEEILEIKPATTRKRNKRINGN